MKKYLVINQPDGDHPYVDFLDEDALKHRLESEWYGGEFLSEWPGYTDGCLRSSAGSTIIFEAKVVTPKPIEVVKKYELA